MSHVAEKPIVDVGHSCWGGEYLLAHCEGYRVESDQGPLGYVEEVVWSSGGEWSTPYSEPVALHVACKRGRLSIPIRDVRELHADDMRIVVHAPSRRPPLRS